MHCSVNHVVPPGQVLNVAIEWARRITENSPDAVASTKRAILFGKQYAGIEPSTIAHAWSIESKRVYEGENIKVGFCIKQRGMWLMLYRQPLGRIAGVCGGEHILCESVNSLIDCWSL